MNSFLSVSRNIIRVLAWHIKYEKHKQKELKNISEELITIVWHLKRWWNFCISQDEKKETEPIFTEYCF